MKFDVETDIKQIKSRLREQIGDSKYEIWFSKSDFCVENDMLRVLAPNAFIGGMLRRNYRNEIDLCVKDVLGSKVSVVVDISSPSADAKPAQQRQRIMPLAEPIVVDTETAKPAKTNLKGLKHTLDTFVVGSKNRMAFEAAKVVSVCPGKTYNPLFFYGGYGLGKTHLLHAICNNAAAENKGVRCVYISAEEFTNQYVNALRTSQIDKFRKKYRSVDILAIDDIHFLANKTSTQEEFLHTFNSIDLANKQIVLASDAHPTMIASLADNLVNRFVSGMVIKIESPDYETRLEICRRKAMDMGFGISEDILEYVAANISTSVRDLEGALLKLNAHVMFTKEPLSLAIAQYLLGSAGAISAPAVRVDEVEAAVAAFFSVKTKDIRSVRKDRTVSLARSVAMHLLRKHTVMSFPEIGKALGGKNHATVILACKKIKQLTEANSTVRWKAQGSSRNENINAILKQLEDTII